MQKKVHGQVGRNAGDPGEISAAEQMELHRDTTMIKARTHWHWIGLVALLVAAAVIRFADLSRAATRSDEMNFVHQAASGASLVDLWMNPPWLNQIPFADSMAWLWAHAQPWRKADEGMVREPFALFGLLTVGLCVYWLWRRRGLGAAWLGAAWLGFCPFLVYHSREAYYYAVGMFFATGMILRTLAMLEEIARQREPSTKAWGGWWVWTLGTCLSHMALWVLAATLAVLLWAAGWRSLRGAARRSFVRKSVAADALLLLFMSRWIWRAIAEIIKISSNPTLAHIGIPFDWMAPRVLPVFFGGANAVGTGLLAATLLAAAGLRWRRPQVSAQSGQESSMGWLSWAVWLGFAVTLAYVGVTGGGAGKWVYFSGVAPLLLTWAVCIWDRLFRSIGEKAHAWGMVGCTLTVGLLLSFPAWQVARLEGKPTAYRNLRAWLDSNLAIGDVAIVDRWLEPWNEMALYPSSNMTVSFTVPDEPYENYVNYNWRKTTQALFERNGAQAFIRIARNHEKRIGPWTWPDKWFAQRAVVTNAAGVWLRDTGFAPMEEFYSETNRVETEVFYDTHEDVAARATAAGQDAVWFFGAGWRLFKPWQQGDFSDYHVLEDEATMTIHNLRPVPLKMRGEVVAAAMGGDQRVRIGDRPPLVFAAGQLSGQTFDLDLPPGIHSLRWKRLGQGGGVLVRDFRLELAD